MTPFEREQGIQAHRSEVEWMIRGYRLMADALERDINHVRIRYDDGQTPLAEVLEHGEWVTVGHLLDLARLDERLGYLRDLENGNESR